LFQILEEEGIEVFLVNAHMFEMHLVAKPMSLIASGFNSCTLLIVASSYRPAQDVAPCVPCFVKGQFGADVLYLRSTHAKSMTQMISTSSRHSDITGQTASPS